MTTRWPTISIGIRSRQPSRRLQTEAGIVALPRGAGHCVIRWCVLCVVLSQCPGCIPPDPPGLPVEGTVVDVETGEPLSGVGALIRTLCCGDTEVGRGAALIENGELFVRTFPLAGSFATERIETTITRGSCDTRFVFEKNVGFTVVNFRLFDGELTFRITDPIRVPPCAEDGDGPP